MGSAPAARDAARALLGASYEVQTIGAGPLVAHGPGVSLALRWPLGVAAGAAVQYRLPLRIDDDWLAARLQVLSIRGMAAWAPPGTGGISFRAAAGAGADLVYVQPERVGMAAATPEPARWATVPCARIVAGPMLRLGESAWGSLSFGTDLDFTRTRYMAVRDGAPREVYVPWRIRPFVSLEVLASP